MRPLWSGSISFGLVNIPVRLYGASRESTLDFHLLHRQDLAPIRYVRVCADEAREVPYEDIVKAYEYEKGEFVVMDDEDLRRAQGERPNTLEINEFSLAGEIDPVYYEKPYYLEPDRGAAKAYALLREALRRSGKVGVAKFVMRGREHLAVIRAMDDLLVLHQLRFAEEIRSPEGLKLPGGAELKQSEVELALALVDKLTEEFEPRVYKDTYSRELRMVLEEKAKGRAQAPRERPAGPSEVKDLMAVLKASLEAPEKTPARAGAEK